MMKYGTLFLLIVCVLPLYAGVKGDVRQGGKLYSKGKYGQALTKYQHALQQDPHNAQASFGAGASAYYLKEYPQAAQAFEQAAQVDEGLHQDALFNLGNTYYRAGEKQQAISAYKQAILANPQDKEAIHNLQLLLQEQKNQQNKNDQNNQNQDKNSQNQDRQEQNNQGQAPQQNPAQDPQPQDPQQQKDQLDKQDAQRVMQLARDNEYKRPMQPGPADGDDSVEKDW